MGGTLDQVVHMGGRLDRQWMRRKPGAGRNVGRHFTSKLQLLVGTLRQQHDHEVLKRDDTNAQLHQFGIR